MNKETCYSVICCIVTKLKVIAIPTGGLGLCSDPGHPMYQVFISSTASTQATVESMCVHMQAVRPWPCKHTS